MKAGRNPEELTAGQRWPRLRARAFVATWALIAAWGISLAIGAFWAAAFAIMGIAAMGMPHTTAPAATPLYQPFIGFGVAVASAVAMVVVYLASAVAIKLSVRPRDDTSAMSAACVAAATVLATAASLPAIERAAFYRVTWITIAYAIGVWCAAFAGTLPRSSRRWTVVFVIVFVLMTCLAYVTTVKFRL
jgi:hypothetical protein